MPKVVEVKPEQLKALDVKYTITQVTVRIGLTVNTGDYGNIRPEVELQAVVAPGATLDAIAQALFSQCTEILAARFAGVASSRQSSISKLIQAEMPFIQFLEDEDSAPTGPAEMDTDEVDPNADKPSELDAFFDDRLTDAEKATRFDPSLEDGNPDNFGDND